MPFSDWNISSSYLLLFGSNIFPGSACFLFWICNLDLSVSIAPFHPTSYEMGLLAWYAVLIFCFLRSRRRAVAQKWGGGSSLWEQEYTVEVAKGRVSRKSTLSLEKCHGRDRRLAPQRAQNSTGCYALSDKIWAETLTFVLQSIGPWQGDGWCINCDFSSSPGYVQYITPLINLNPCCWDSGF